MRRHRHFYQVILTIENRWDVDDDWERVDKILYKTDVRDKALHYIYHHRYLETPLEHNDNGDHWTHIQTLHLIQLR